MFLWFACSLLEVPADVPAVCQLMRGMEQLSVTLVLLLGVLFLLSLLL